MERSKVLPDFQEKFNADITLLIKPRQITISKKVTKLPKWRGFWLNNREREREKEEREREREEGASTILT